MNTKYITTLEYDKLLEKVERYCKTYIGKEMLKNMVPQFQKQAVMHLLEETKEAVYLIVKKSGIPIGEIPNISIWNKRLESGSALSAKGLLEVDTILKITREVKEYFYENEEESLNVTYY